MIKKYDFKLKIVCFLRYNIKFKIKILLISLNKEFNDYCRVYIFSIIKKNNNNKIRFILQDRIIILVECIIIYLNILSSVITFFFFKTPRAAEVKDYTIFTSLYISSFLYYY